MRAHTLNWQCSSSSSSSAPPQVCAVAVAPPQTHARIAIIRITGITHNAPGLCRTALLGTTRVALAIVRVAVQAVTRTTWEPCMRMMRPHKSSTHTHTDVLACTMNP